MAPDGNRKYEPIDEWGSRILTDKEELIDLTQEQIDALAKQKASSNYLLRYCRSCRAVWVWKGGSDPCPKCSVIHTNPAH